MAKNDNHYMGVLLEDMDNKYDLIMEVLDTLRDVPADIRQLKEDMVEVKSTLAAIKPVLIKRSRTLKRHETRITKLEAA